MSALTGSFSFETKVVFKDTEFNRFTQRFVVVHRKGVIRRKTSDGYFIENATLHGPIKAKDISLDIPVKLYGDDKFIRNQKRLWKALRKAEFKEQIGVKYGDSLFHCGDLTNRVFWESFGKDAEKEIKKRYFDSICCNAVIE